MAAIELILLQRVEKLGQMGDVVKVKPGYARNFLLPQKKATRATKANVAQFETQRAQLEALNLKRREEAERVAERFGDLSVVIIRQAVAIHSADASACGALPNCQFARFDATDLYQVVNDQPGECCEPILVAIGVRISFRHARMKRS